MKRGREKIWKFQGSGIMSLFFKVRALSVANDKNYQAVSTTELKLQSEYNENISRRRTVRMISRSRDVPKVHNIRA